MMINKLVNIRKSNNIKQIDLAKKLNITEATYINYEKGHRPIPSDVLLQICTLFEVTPNDIFDYKRENEEYILTPRESFSLMIDGKLIKSTNKYDFLHNIDDIKIESNYMYLKTTDEFNSHNLVIPRNSILLIGVKDILYYKNHSICLLQNNGNYFLSEVYVNDYSKEVTYFYQDKPIIKHEDEFDDYILVGTVKKVILDL